MENEINAIRYTLDQLKKAQEACAAAGLFMFLPSIHGASVAAADAVGAEFGAIRYKEDGSRWQTASIDGLTIHMNGVKDA